MNNSRAQKDAKDKILDDRQENQQTNVQNFYATSCLRASYSFCLEAIHYISL